MVAIDVHSIFLDIMEVNGLQKLFGNQHTLKYLLQIWNNLMMNK